MRRLITAGIVMLIGWEGYNTYHRHQLASQEPSVQRFTETSADEEAADVEPDPEDETQQDAAAEDDASYSCDGRMHCSQMTSCEEATWFINHCPGMKMDGDNDGIPCEESKCSW